MKYPALDVEGIDQDFLLALLDDFNPSAVDTHESVVTIYFPDRARRDRALDAVMGAHPQATVRAREVDDEDWARRSQETLTSITVGRITVAPPWNADSRPRPASLATGSIQIVIAPSMGFGTGHHATTRLCLRALQELDLTGARVLDVGTGSGVLAIAARALGAHDVMGIDDDRDAIQAATENLAANPYDHTHFDVKDLRSATLPAVDVITANLTGALLARSADLLLRALNPGGTLIVSGLQTHERDAVRRAFGKAAIEWEASEDEWVAMILRIQP